MDMIFDKYKDLAGMGFWINPVYDNSGLLLTVASSGCSFSSVITGDLALRLAHDLERAAQALLIKETA